MKIRRSMVVMFIIATFIIPISLYRTRFSADASEEFLSTMGIISGVLMTVFLLLVFAFSIFSDDYPHAYEPKKSGLLGTVAMLMAIGCGYSTVYGLLGGEQSATTGSGGIAMAILGFGSVLAFMFYSITFFKGENTIFSFPVIPILPALWYGLRMLSAFLRSASMADISSQLPVIAMCCSFTIFLLTLGKLFCGVNSNSIKWGFATGCIGILTSLLYTADFLVNKLSSISDLMVNPTAAADLIMALFAIGSLFHISRPAQFFEDEEWDDYFYDTYNLPKPNLILHTPVDELEEDSLLDDDINESPYIPVNSSIGRGNGGSYASRQPSRQEPQRRPVRQERDYVPSYIANPAAYYPQYNRQQQYQGNSAQGYYPPAYPNYPVYPYQGIVRPDPRGGYGNYGQAPAPRTEYVDPYDSEAAQYQYERRRAELQSRELEKLTGEVDSSLAKLQGSVSRSQPPSSQRVDASPDERIGGRTEPQTGRNVRLAQGYSQSGERLTDRIDRLGQERSASQQPPEPDEDEYTYEYYYPNDRSRYSLNQFNPTDSGRNNQSGRR